MSQARSAWDIKTTKNKVPLATTLILFISPVATVPPAFGFPHRNAVGKLKIRGKER